MNFSKDDLSCVIEIAKQEIRADIASGLVPPDVHSFSQLHDYVDANEYGAACEAWYEDCTGDDQFVDFWNAVQDELDSWLKAGRP